jgi:hypothetical protein
MRRHREAAGSFHYGGKLELHAGEREPEDAFLLRIFVLAILMMMIMMGRICRFHNYGPTQVCSQDSDEKEFPLRFHTRLFGQIRSQVPFGQKVREKWRQTAAHWSDRGHQAARLSFVCEAKCWPVGIINIILFERKDMAISGKPINDADALFMQIDSKRVDLLQFGIY